MWGHIRVLRFLVVAALATTAVVVAERSQPAEAQEPPIDVDVGVELSSRRRLTNLWCLRRGRSTRSCPEEAAGDALDDLEEFKPGWWQGTREAGELVKIEVELEGHEHLNEGPHVTVRVLKDVDKGPKGGWKVIEEIFIEGRETWRSLGGSW